MMQEVNFFLQEIRKSPPIYEEPAPNPTRMCVFDNSIIKLLYFEIHLEADISLE